MNPDLGSKIIKLEETASKELVKKVKEFELEKTALNAEYQAALEELELRSDKEKEKITADFEQNKQNAIADYIRQFPAALLAHSRQYSEKTGKILEEIQTLGAKAKESEELCDFLEKQYPDNSTQMPKLLRAQYDAAKNVVQKYEKLKQNIHSDSLPADLLSDFQLTLICNKSQPYKIVVPPEAKNAEHGFVSELVKVAVLEALCEHLGPQKITYETNGLNSAFVIAQDLTTDLSDLEQKIRKKFENNNLKRARINFAGILLAEISEEKNLDASDDVGAEKEIVYSQETRPEGYLTLEQAAKFLFDLPHSESKIENFTTRLRERNIESTTFFDNTQFRIRQVQNDVFYNKKDIEKYKNECMIPVNNERKYELFTATIIKVDKKNIDEHAKRIAEICGHRSASYVKGIINFAKPIEIKDATDGSAKYIHPCMILTEIALDPRKTRT